MDGKSCPKGYTSTNLGLVDGESYKFSTDKSVKVHRKKHLYFAKLPIDSIVHHD